MALDPDTLAQLRGELIADEGYSRTPYDDKTGKAPVLARATTRGLSLSGGKVSIGIGRNLSDRPLSDAVIELLFAEDVAIAEGIVRRLFPFDRFSRNRKCALLNMAFNLGESRLMGFRKLIAAVRAGDWNKAADEALDSKWAKQVQTTRSQRIARQLREG